MLSKLNKRPVSVEHVHLLGEVFKFIFYQPTSISEDIMHNINLSTSCQPTF
jgi:hypothetical protein